MWNLFVMTSEVIDHVQTTQYRTPDEMYSNGSPVVRYADGAPYTPILFKPVFPF